jgi:hypothetical protein
MRTCCDSNSGFSHRKYCHWARKHCPPWIDPFITEALDPGYRNRVYYDALKGTIIMRTWPNGDKKAGKITYCWLGTHGWPVTFRIDDSWDCNVEDAVCLSTNPCIYPRLPTAEEIYELITR